MSASQSAPPGVGKGRALEVLVVALHVRARPRLAEDAGRRIAPSALFAETVEVGIGLRHLLAGPPDAELARLQLALHVAEHGVEEGLERFGGRMVVRVRVEYPVAVAHGRPHWGRCAGVYDFSR